MPVLFGDNSALIKLNQLTKFRGPLLDFINESGLADLYVTKLAKLM